MTPADRPEQGSSVPGEDSRPNLIVFADDWGRHPSSCQHLVRNLLPRFRVYWVNTIGTRPPRFDLLTWRRGWGKIGQWMSIARRTSMTGSHNPTVLSPLMWPSFHPDLGRRLNTHLLERTVRRALPHGERCLAVTTIPLVADLVGRDPAQHWIYYCVDDLGEWPGLDRETLQRMERDLVSRVDEIVAVSRGLVARMAALGRPATLLTHGVDLEHWRQGKGHRLQGFDELSRPLIVFWGVIDRRLQISWLERLVETVGSGSIVLVGPANNPNPRLESMSRVFLQGPMPYESLPDLASLSSVLIMPYADLPATRAMQPLKLKEYLATDRPVVVSDLPAVDPWRDACDVVDTADAFAEAVARRLRTGLPEDQRSARVRLQEETWTHKAGVFEEILLGAAKGSVERL